MKICKTKSFFLHSLDRLKEGVLSYRYLSGTFITISILLTSAGSQPGLLNANRSVSSRYCLSSRLLRNLLDFN